MVLLGVCLESVPHWKVKLYTGLKFSQSIYSYSFRITYLGPSISQTILTSVPKVAGTTVLYKGNGVLCAELALYNSAVLPEEP